MAYILDAKGKAKTLALRLRPYVQGYPIFAKGNGAEHGERAVRAYNRGLGLLPLKLKAFFLQFSHKIRPKC